MTDNLKSWSATKQGELTKEVTGFWAQQVWQMRKIPVPHNEQSKHQCDRFLHFVFHSCAVNFEMKYALKQSFLSRKWVPWSQHISTGLRWFTLFFNETCEKDIDTLLAHPLSQWLSELSCWLQKNHPKNRCPLGFLQTVYNILEDFYDQRDEWEKDCINLQKAGLPVSKNMPHRLWLTRLSQLWLRDLVRQYFKLQVKSSAARLSAQLHSFVYFSTFLVKKESIQCASDVNRDVIEEFLTYLRLLKLKQNSQSQAIGAPLSKQSHARILGDLRLLFDFCVSYELAAFPKRLLFNEDIPFVPRLSEARGIPDSVVAQLLVHKDQLAQPFQTMLQVILEIGCRPGELCELPIDCLTIVNQGGPYVTRYAKKQYKSISVPVSNEIANAIRSAQQWAKQHYGESVKYLFPKNVDQYYHRMTFNQNVNHYIARQKITDENGQLWHFTAKQCRHTVGTRLINEGVSQSTVQRFLGHSSPKMTNVYAHLHDQTLKEAFFNSKRHIEVEQPEKASELVQGQVFNALGEQVESSWLKHHFQAQALPNGFCVRPQEIGVCQSGQACLHCTHLRTTVDHLPILQEQLALGEDSEKQAAEKGFERLCQANAKNNQALRKLINVLIKTGGFDA